MSTRISRHRLAEFVTDRLIAGDQNIVRELAAYIVEHRLMRELDLIVTEIEQAYADRGEVVADVTSARTLDDASRRELKQFISAGTGAQSVELRESIDAELIGGVVINTPGSSYDGSLARQLTQLKMKSNEQ